MTVRKTIILSEEQEKWVQSQVDSGDYADDSDYVTELIRRDQKDATRDLALKRAIQEGVESGISEKSVEQIMEEVEARMRADGRL